MKEIFITEQELEYLTDIPKEYILAPDEDLARAITGEELIKRLIPRIEKTLSIESTPN